MQTVPDRHTIGKVGRSPCPGNCARLPAAYMQPQAAFARSLCIVILCKRRSCDSNGMVASHMKHQSTFLITLMTYSCSMT